MAFSFLKSRLDSKSWLFKVKFHFGHKISFLKSRPYVKSRFIKSRLYCVYIRRIAPPGQTGRQKRPARVRATPCRLLRHEGPPGDVDLSRGSRPIGPVRVQRPGNARRRASHRHHRRGNRRSLDPTEPRGSPGRIERVSKGPDGGRIRVPLQGQIQIVSE